MRPGAPAPLARVAPWLVAVAAIVVYANALQNGFVLDDETVVLRNPIVHHLDGVWRSFSHAYWPGAGGQYRPLVISTFAVEWSVWGAAAPGYHAVNVGMHGLASVLVYVVARRWLSLVGALVAGLAFAVHPVHVEAVAGIVGRAELLAATGVLAMVLLHERRSPWAVVAFAFALFSKEHAVVAPALVGTLDAAARTLSGRRSPGEAARSTRDGEAGRGFRAAEFRLLSLYAGYALATIGWVAAVVLVFGDRPLALVDPLWLSMDTSGRVLTMLGAVPTLVRLWFAPFELTADYSPRVTVPWPENNALIVAGVALIGTALVLAAASWRKYPQVAIPIGWIAVAMLPVSNLLMPTGIVVAERTLYLSSVGAALLIGAALEWIGRAKPAMAVAALLAVVCTYAGRTWVRTPVWESNRELLIATAQSHPQASTTRLLLARVHARTGNARSALDEYRVSLGLFPGNPVAWAEAIEVAGRSGDVRLADSLIGAARGRVPPSYVVSAARASIAVSHFRYAEALRAANEAITLAPDSVRGYHLAARAWLGLGMPDSARASLLRSPGLVSAGVDSAMAGFPERARD